MGCINKNCNSTKTDILPISNKIKLIKILFGLTYEFRKAIKKSFCPIDKVGKGIKIDFYPIGKVGKGINMNKSYPDAKIGNGDKVKRLLTIKSIN